MNKRTLLYSGCIYSESGYGQKAADIGRSLIEIANENDFKLLIYPLRWGNTPDVKRPEFDLYTLKSNQIEGNVELYIHCGMPDECYFDQASNSLLFSSTVETTILPARYIESVNKNYTSLIVPSEFNRLVAVDSKYKLSNGDLFELTKPVITIHEGIRPIESTKFDLSNVKEQFAFISVGTWLPGDIGEDRKDIGMMIKTFLETFKNKQNQPALIFKSSLGASSISDQLATIEKINEIKATVSGNFPNIYLIHGELTDGEMKSLYEHHKVKAMVSFTKGESVGRPLLEFAMTGKPVIASGFSGLLDFLSKGHPILGGELTNVHPSVANEILMKESQWFTVDYIKAADTLRDVKNNYQKYLEKSSKEKKNIQKQFSYDTMKNKIKDVVSQYMPKQTELVIPDFLQ